MKRIKGIRHSLRQINGKSFSNSRKTLRRARHRPRFGLPGKRRRSACWRQLYRIMGGGPSGRPLHPGGLQSGLEKMEYGNAADYAGANAAASSGQRPGPAGGAEKAAAQPGGGKFDLRHRFRSGGRADFSLYLSAVRLPQAFSAAVGFQYDGRGPAGGLCQPAPRCGLR